VKKKRFAIVSSYSESCGNAAFSRVLHDSIEHFYPDIDVAVVELDLRLLQSIDSKIRRKADEHIARLGQKLVDHDSVNIQMEAGLYGTVPSDIVRRFKRLLTANRSTSVTFHAPRLIQSSSFDARSGLKKLFKMEIRAGFREIVGSKFANIHVRINKKCIQAAAKRNTPLIVHTGRAKKQIGDLFGYDNIFVHPLRLVPADYSCNRQTLDEIKRQLALTDGDVLIGIFGYISAYKGHTDALKALQLLPDHYKLLIFGRQHPQTLSTSGVVDPYLEHLVHIATTTEKLKGRVFFLGELADQEFLDVASTVDVAWLPYYENGQDGSGIASICLDCCPRVLCSTSFAFDELFKLVKYHNVSRFDIGNTHELAIKTEMALRAEKPRPPFSSEAEYNLKTQAAAYVRCLIP